MKNFYPLLDDFESEKKIQAKQLRVIIVFLSLLFCIVNPILGIFLGQQSTWLDLVWLIPAYTIISFLAPAPFVLGFTIIMMPCLLIYNKLKSKVLDLFVAIFRIPYAIIMKIQYTGFWLIAHLMIFVLLLYLGFTDSTQIDFRF